VAFGPLLPNKLKQSALIKKRHESGKPWIFSLDSNKESCKKLAY